MNTQQLKDGISILFDMEINNYNMTRSIEKLDNQISSLGHKHQYSYPVMKEGRSFSVGRTFAVSLISSICILLLGLFISYLFDNNSSIRIDELLSVIKISFFTGLIAGALVDVLIQLAQKSICDSRIKSEYDDEIKHIKELERKDEERVKKELEQKKFLLNEKNILLSKKASAIENTTKFYNDMKIDPHYRNLIPIGYMHEYAKLGIATKLEGVDGLYNLVRKDLRQDQFKYQLEDISRKMDQIIDNQHSMYTVLCRINSKCNNMIQSVVSLSKQINTTNQSLQEISAKSEIAAYNSERSRKELEYQSFMRSIGLH